MEESSAVIGKKVRKKSGKPFKSGNLVNTITGIIINPRSPKNEKVIFNLDGKSVWIKGGIFVYEEDI